MIRAALAVAVLLLAPEAGAQAKTKTISGDWISLGDVAPVTGEAASILIGAAPPLGQTLALDPVFIVSIAKRAGVILAIPLDQPIMVARGPSRTAPAAKAANTARPANQAPVIGAASAAQAQVLILAHDVPRGQRLTDADLDWADPAQARTSRGLTNIDLAVGMETKRPLRAGQAVLSNDLKQPAVVRKGERVKIIYTSPGLRLSVEGLAQADAAKGEPVRVLNSFSKRTIDAVASGDGEAIVGR